jgi:hypothetical protein
MERSYFGDYKELVKKANDRLPIELQVKDDDPTLCLLVIADEMLNCYIQAAQNMLIETHDQLTNNQRLEMERTKLTIERLMDQSKDKLEQQLNAVGETWETRFKQSAQEEQVKFKKAAGKEMETIQQTARLSIYGSGIILASGTLWLGMLLGNLIFSGKP